MPLQAIVLHKAMTDLPPSPPENAPKYIKDGVLTQDLAMLEQLRDWIDEMIAYRLEPVEADELPDSAEPVDGGDTDESGKGTLVTETVTCGDESCHCMSGSGGHGPYLYRYFREGGDLTSEYVGKPGN